MNNLTCYDQSRAFSCGYQMTLPSVRTGVNHKPGPKQHCRKQPEQSRDQTNPQITLLPRGIQIIQCLTLANELNHST